MNKLLKKYKEWKEHEHSFSLRWDNNGDIWAECKCGKQIEIPDGRADEAYLKIGRGELAWESDT